MSSIQAIHAGPLGTGRVFTAKESGHVVAHEATTGRQLWKSLHAPNREVWHLVGATLDDAPHPEALFSGGSGGSVVSWDARTGNELWRCNQHQGPQGVQALFYRQLFDTICVAPRMWVGAAAKPPTLHSLDGRNGVSLWSTPSDDVQFLQGTRQYLYAANSKTIQAWDTLNNNLAWQVEMPGKSIIQAFGYADDLEAICIGSNQGLHLLDSKNGSSRGQVPMSAAVGALIYADA